MKHNIHIEKCLKHLSSVFQTTMKPPSKSGDRIGPAYGCNVSCSSLGLGEVSLLLVCLDIEDVAQLRVGRSPWVRLGLSEQKFKITIVGGKCPRANVASVLPLGFCVFFPLSLQSGCMVC